VVHDGAGVGFRRNRFTCALCRFAMGARSAACSTVWLTLSIITHSMHTRRSVAQFVLNQKVEEK